MTVREHRAKQLAAVTGLLVVTLSIVAAFVQGDVAERAAAARRAADGAALVRGQLVYERSGCARCHSIAGVGSPRAPLDGVGSRLSPEQIVAWMRADAGVTSALPRSVVSAKAVYRKMPDVDSQALAQWLAETTRR